MQSGVTAPEFGEEPLRFGNHIIEHLMQVLSISYDVLDTTAITHVFFSSLDGLNMRRLEFSTVTRENIPCL